MGKFAFKFIHMFFVKNHRKFDMTKKTDISAFADKITSRPEIASNPFFAEIIRGMYQGMPLFGKNGLLTPLIDLLRKLKF